MRGSASLAARIARLEAQRSPRRSHPRLAFRVHHDDSPDAMVEGWRTPEGIMVPRKPDEALSGALARAWQHPGVGMSLFAVYAPEPAPDAMTGRSVLPPPTAPVDPNALAGIGRAATDAELHAMAMLAT